MITHRKRLQKIESHWMSNKRREAYFLMDTYIKDEHGAQSLFEQIPVKFQEYEKQLDLLNDFLRFYMLEKNMPSPSDKVKHDEVMLAFKDKITVVRKERDEMLHLIEHLRRIVG